MSASENSDVHRTVFRSSPLIPPSESTADATGHYLVVMEGAEPGKCIEVADAPVTIGRDARQTVVVGGDSQISRLHARVSLVGGGVVAEDMGSTNGTFAGTLRITQPTVLTEGQLLRVGQQILRYERRNRRDVKRGEELSRDLRKASMYVLSLLPPPISSGPVHVDWHFQPSAQLGGDAFGYYWLDPGTFIFYLMDVSGHGVGPAMHSVTVMNVLRQRALPGIDFTSPPDVLASLNARFPMDQHNSLYFTMGYGVYRTGDRTLTYSSGGHNPSFLVSPERAAAQPLGLPGLMIGAIPDQTYDVQETTVPPGSRLYLFSDGVFEVATKDQGMWMLADFLPLLLEPPVDGRSEPARLFQRVRETAKAGPLDDDFSLMTVTFP
jgi:serine phosphatase RsbU (regulator of sigma subunit)